MNYNEFEVGDIVTVVDTPYEDCPFSWVETMDEYVSRQAEITHKYMDDTFGTYGYSIDIDDGNHTWCGNCFVEKEMPDFDTAESADIAAFLGV